jgi:hypothetical protein
MNRKKLPEFFKEYDVPFIGFAQLASILGCCSSKAKHFIKGQRPLPVGVLYTLMGFQTGKTNELEAKKLCNDFSTLQLRKDGDYRFPTEFVKKSEAENKLHREKAIRQSILSEKMKEQYIAELQRS